MRASPTSARGGQPFWLGGVRPDGAERVTLPASALLRHMMALGSSGSGKTVLSKVVVEECARSGVPAICIDPQGDICSLLARADAQELISHGIDPTLAERFAERLDVVIFTPGSTAGVALCADPVDAGIASLPADERCRALTRVAATMTSLLGYQLGSNDGDGLCAALDQALSERLAAGKPLTQLQHIADELAERDRDGYASLGQLLAPRKIQQARQRLARLDVGARRAVFHEGLAIDVDMLLGRDETAVIGKTRISVIYLNALEQQEDKELVVAALVDRLYRWMLRHPQEQLQALFYIDEVAPFIPPVRKPACKDGLQLLFKQARKYGVGCLMATQNPGDVDYKAMAQFGTWALGRITTRQDRQKLEPTVRSLADDRADAVMAELPQLRAGQFVLLSPDHFAHPVPLQCRWLLSAHQTLDERRIRQLGDERWRKRFAKTPVPEPAMPQPTAPVTAALVSPPAAGVPPAGVPTAAVPPATVSKAVNVPTASARRAPLASAADNRPAKPAQRERDSADWMERLAERPSLDVPELATLFGVSDSTARRRAEQLVERGLLRAFQQGRSKRYWALSSGLRPDLGLEREVATAAATVTQTQALLLAQAQCRSRVLGVLGEDEQVSGLSLRYRPLVRIDFEEQVPRSLLLRALGPSHDQLRGSVYLHALDLRYLTLSPGAGISFAARPADYASRIPDLDGVVHWLVARPAELAIDEAMWGARVSPEQAIAHFRAHYSAEVLSTSYLFLPYWEAVLAQAGGRGYRVVTFDALLGKALAWDGVASGS